MSYLRSQHGSSLHGSLYFFTPASHPWNCFEDSYLLIFCFPKVFMNFLFLFFLFFFFVTRALSGHSSENVLLMFNTCPLWPYQNLLLLMLQKIQKSFFAFVSSWTVPLPGKVRTHGLRIMAYLTRYCLHCQQFFSV